MPVTPFLSYARQDHAEAIKLVGVLQSLDYLVQWDAQLRGGQPWLEQLEAMAGKSDACLIMIGTRGVDRFVKAECQLAINRHFDGGKAYPVVPVLLPGITPQILPPFLSLFHALSFEALLSPDGQALLTAALAANDADKPLARLPWREQCPYPGFMPFDEASGEFFVGREQETFDVLARFGLQRDRQARRWVNVAGTSGAGKSSLVRAGIIPAVRSGWVVDAEHGGSRHWQIVVVRPGVALLENLTIALRKLLDALGRPSPAALAELAAGHTGEDARALAKAIKEALRHDERLLLIIDQFEEVFTLGGGSPAADGTAGNHRQRIDTLLHAALSDPDCPCYLLTTIRSDFGHRLAELPNFARLKNADGAGQYTLLPMGERALQQIVTIPTRRAGGDFDTPALPAMIVAEALKSGDAALPMISNVMVDLWRQPDPAHCLSSDVYLNIGGVGGALARRADQVVAEFSADEAAVRDFFLALVRPGRDGPDTRRVISYATALAAAGPDRHLAERILLRFSGGAAEASRDRELIRLVSLHEAEGDAGEGAPPPQAVAATVELSHEVLLGWQRDADDKGRRRAWWPRLRTWIEAHRPQLDSRELLTLRARRWHEAGRPQTHDLLAAGQELAVFALLRNATDSVEDDYVAASAALRQAQIDNKRAADEEARRGRARLTWAATLMAVLALAGTGYYVFSAHLNDGQRDYVRGLPSRSLAYLAWCWSGEVLNPAMVVIPSGSFVMGSPATEEDSTDSERPTHQVSVSEFKLSKTEITFDEYDQFAIATWRPLSDARGWDRSTQPVINVSYEDAQAYAAWLTKRTGDAYRLPSEAEWEYAARAGSTGKYWWGEAVRRGQGGEVMANCDGCGSRWDNKQTSPVGRFAANAFDLVDMHGNVWEWTSDCWHGDYDKAPSDGRAWEKEDGGDCAQRVVRGGSWYHGPASVRSAYRYGNGPDEANDILGFRLARTK